MTDFVKESRNANELEKLRLQRITQLKNLTKWNITNGVAVASTDKLRSKKSKVKKTTKTNMEAIAKNVEIGLEELEDCIKGKIIKGMKDAYAKENRKIREF